VTDRIASRTAASATARAERLLTIGRLAELTGVPVRTIRFYSDTAVDGSVLPEPAGRTAASYRLYPIEAAARLELIRTLRDLGVGLPTVARVLARTGALRAELGTPSAA
jgi:DNA-binding transcriptional MerR regulator